jgi:MinD-like ATPase involved in chromosome partitioning or flagellar assembly
MDLQFGDISILAGNEPASRIQRLSIETLCKGQARIPALEGSILLLEAPSRPEQAEELALHLPQLLTALAAQADIVLVNTASLWDEALAVLASSADKLLICMDQRATSVSAARQVVELCIRLQIPSTKLCYLLNRCARNAPITDLDASLALGGVEIISIAEGGTDVDELLSLGCPLELLSAQSSHRQSVSELGLRLLAKPGSEPGPRSWSR